MSDSGCKFLKSGNKQIKTLQSNCGRQKEPTILISRLLLRMRHMDVANIRLDFY